MKASLLGIGLSAALALLGCGTQVDEGDAGGGSTLTLEAHGTVENTCGPADGPAVNFRIGAPATCPIQPYAQPFAHFYGFPGRTSEFMPGQTWSSDKANGTNQASVEWFPEGSDDNHSPAQSGKIAIISVDSGAVHVKYLFVTPEGETYAGEADVVVCPSTPMCG